jgi:hypothetical protein
MSEIKFGAPSGYAPDPNPNPNLNSNSKPVIDVKTEVVPTPDPETKIETTTTVAPPVTVPQVRPPCCALAPSGLVLGDKLPDFKDIILPRLNLVQNIGGLKDLFDPGTIVFGHVTGEQTILFTPQRVDPKTGNVVHPPSPPATVCVLGFRPTRFVEKVVGGARGLIVNTEEEVRANGGTVDYNEHKLKKAAGMKLFQPLADAVIAVEAPAGMTAAAAENSPFIYEVLGKHYALGLWSMKGSIYTAAAKQVFFTNRAMGYLSKGYPTRMFSVTAFEKSFENGNKSWVPTCIPCCVTPPEFLVFVARVLNAPEAPAGE